MRFSASKIFGMGEEKVQADNSKKLSTGKYSVIFSKKFKRKSSMLYHFCKHQYVGSDPLPYNLAAFEWYKIKN